LVWIHRKDDLSLKINIIPTLKRQLSSLSQ
jgi:hypothetical protein